jgi:hypothetical protein
MSSKPSISFTVGFLLRRQVRFAAASLGLEAQEFKGLLESNFVLTGDQESVARMAKWLNRLEKA